MRKSYGIPDGVVLKSRAFKMEFEGHNPYKNGLTRSIADSVLDRRIKPRAMMTEWLGTVTDIANSKKNQYFKKDPKMAIIRGITSKRAKSTMSILR